MPYHLDWYDDEQTILVISADGKITWEENHAINDEAHRMIESADRRIDLIFHSQVGLPPGNPLPHFRTAFSQWQNVPNLGLVVAISFGRIGNFFKAAAEIAGRLVGSKIPQNVKIADSFEDAVALIRSDRLTREREAEKPV